MWLYASEAGEGFLIHLSSNISHGQQGSLPANVVLRGWHVDCGSAMDPLHQRLYPGSSSKRPWRIIMHSMSRRACRSPSDTTLGRLHTLIMKAVKVGRATGTLCGKSFLPFIEEYPTPLTIQSAPISTPICGPLPPRHHTLGLDDCIKQPKINPAPLQLITAPVL